MPRPKLGKIGLEVEQAHQRLMRLGREMPEFLLAARAALRPWETREEMLMAAIAIALKEMYDLGRAGKDVSRVFLQPAAPVDEPLEDDKDEEDQEDDEPQDPAAALRARIALTLASRAPVKKRRRRH